MQKEYEIIKNATVSFTDTKEQIIENELSLPDYYPEIIKVLKCRIVPGIEDITRSGDKVSVSGKADIRLIYTDSDRHIRIFTSLTKYTKIFSGIPESDDEICFVYQTLNGEEYRATAPRKCEIRACNAIKLICIGKKESSVLSSVTESSSEIKFTEKTICSTNALKRFELSFSENVDLPENDDKICDVLYTTQKLEISDVKVIKNKIMLKGSCELYVRFLTSNGYTDRDSFFNIPFTEIISMPGAEEKDVCSLSSDSVCARIAVNENGKSAQVFISAQINAICVEKKTLSLPEDIYSLQEETILQYSEISVIGSVYPIKKGFTVSNDAEVYDDTVVRISAAYADDPDCSFVYYNGQLHLSGTVSVNFYVSDDEGSVTLISRTCKIDEELEISPQEGFGFISCRAEVENTVLKNGRIEYTLKIDADGSYAENSRCRFITDVESGKPIKDPGTENITLYFAHSGESIWDIAKENGCSASKVKEANGLSADTTEDNIMLILM